MVSTYGVEPSVSYEVEVAFAANPWDTSPVYTSISDRVMYLRTFRGKTSPLSEFGPATLEVWLRSNDRRFDPENAAGPYFGSLLPKKRVRVKVIRAGVTIGLLVAFTLAWDQDWERGSPGRVRLTAIDDTDAALNATLPPSAYSAEVTDDAASNYWPLQNADLSNRVSGGVDMALEQSAAATPTIVPQSMGGPVGEDQGVYIPGVAGGIYARSSLSAIPAALDFWVYNQAGVSLNTWAIYAGTSTTNFWKIYSLDNTGFLLTYSHAVDNLKIVGTSVTSVTLTGLHHVAVYRSGSNIVVMIDGSIVKTVALGAGTDAGGPSFATVTLTPSGANTQTPTIGHLATYATAPSETRFNAHYQVGRWGYSGAHGIYGFELEGARIGRMLDDIGHPSNLRNISPGGTRQAAYRPASRTALDGIREAERSGQGVFFFDVDGKATYRDRQWLWVNAADKAVTFSDVVPTPAGKVGYRAGSPKSKDLDTVVNKVTVSYPAGAITNSDATSITAYRERPDFVDCSSAISDPQDASNLGRYRVRTEKDPKSLIPRLTVLMRRDIATTFPKVAALELGDVVTIERTPPGGGAQTSRRHQIIGIEHELTREQWFVNLSLGPAVPMVDEVPYLQLGHATRGKIGAADGNKIPF